MKFIVSPATYVYTYQCMYISKNMHFSCPIFVDISTCTEIIYVYLHLIIFIVNLETSAIFTKFSGCRSDRCDDINVVTNFCNTSVATENFNILCIRLDQVTIYNKCQTYYALLVTTVERNPWR